MIHDPNNNIYLVLHNEKEQSFERLNWTRAHEIGHIYCGHKKNGKIEEIEAHFFAAQFLMPEYTILKMYKYGIVTPETLYSVFNVSFTAAEKRLCTLSKKPINSGILDKKIWNMMEDSIIEFFTQPYSIYINNQ